MMEHNRERLAYLHIGKSAGQWLSAALWEHYGGEKYCPLVFAEQYRRITDDEIQNYSCFGGHFGFNIARKLNSRLITVLRNPVDRILSLYNYWRTVPETNYGPGIAKRLTFAEFILSDDGDVVSDLHNAQAWQLAWEHGSSERSKSGIESDDELFRAAKRNLSQFDVVGVTECLADVATTLHEVFRIGVKMDRPRINVTPNRDRMSDLPLSVRNALLRRLEVDLALYDYVTTEIVFPRISNRLQR